MKRIIVLGATGSIGRQTLDIAAANPDKIKVVGVAAGSNEKEMEKILKEFKDIEAVSMNQVINPDIYEGKKLFTGENGMKELIEQTDYDLLVNATVGFRGLLPTLTSIEKGKDVALANKESLVAGGDLVNAACRKHGVKLYPIDSEHSAIYQCLQGNRKEDVARLIITASGGSLRNLGRDELEDVSVERVLKHPNWSMGSRITVDSASMVNKGFEVIEAHYLFDIPYDQIETVLHDESIIHSMVEYQDHAVIAQLGSADMHLPIQYALLPEQRFPLNEANPLDMTRTMNLHFRQMDFERYPMLKLAYEAGRKGGNQGAVFNGADEEAVSLFLERKISFLDIEKCIEYALNSVKYIPDPDYEQIVESDLAARKAVRTFYDIEVSKGTM